MTSGGADFSASHGSAFGLTSVPHTITVHPGATLQLASSDLQGQFYSTNAITLRVNGGTLTQTAGYVNGLGKLILENATLSYKGIGVQNNYYRVSGDGTETNHVPIIWPTIGFNGGVEFRGTNTYVLANGADDNGNHARLFFGTCDGKPSDIFVDEISGRGAADETTDVTINARLQDAPPWHTYTSDADNRRIITGYYSNLKGLPLNMRKTGPGILVLNSKLSTTTGRIEVVEGTLKMGGGMTSSEANFECPTNTYLGDLRDPNRVALVLNGGTLWIVSNDTFGQANTVNRSLFAVTNGTIRTIATSCTAFPALDLYDATLDYNGGNRGSNADVGQAQPWGTYVFAQRVHFDGTRPYDLQNKEGDTNYFSLGWQSDSYQTPSAYKSGCIDQHGKTEFCVEDITGNANPDVTIGVVLKFPCHWNGRPEYGNSLYSTTYFRTGLLKTGPGTLRLNCGTDAQKYYSEATRVNGGTLLVDAAAFNTTNIFVQAGAYLGGTGTVLRATIEAGGGFTAAPDQTEALTLNAVELPPSGEVTLDVPYTGDVANLESVRVPVVKAIAGLEGAKWRVTMNGATVPEGYVGMANVRNGVVYGIVARGGTYLIIR
jgi:autotransporter-associated beta strand protein